MDFFKGNNKDNAAAGETQNAGNGSGLMNKLNSAMGGGPAGENNEGQNHISTLAVTLNKSLSIRLS